MNYFQQFYDGYVEKPYSVTYMKMTGVYTVVEDTFFCRARNKKHAYKQFLLKCKKRSQAQRYIYDNFELMKHSIRRCK